MNNRTWISLLCAVVLANMPGCGSGLGGVAECGNGIVESGEQCEPPNGLTCSATCQIMDPASAECGNGVVEAGEQCEPPNGITCSAACQMMTAEGPEQNQPQPPACGNGVMDAGETCDPPDGRTCDATCQTLPQGPIEGSAACQTNPREGDMDGDGILDADELAGWTVFVDESGQGDTVPRAVASDPRKADTDGDGLCDAEERTSRTDPTRSDTDVDGLSDFDELRVWGSSPTNVDTDGDATDLGTKPLNSILFDGNEVSAFGTSPTLSDSDGDKISDFVEIIERGNDFNPLVANLPRMELSFEGATDLRVNIAYDDSTQESESHEVSMSSEQSSTFSASTTATVKAWYEVSAKVSAEAGYSVDSNKVGVEVGATVGVSAELSGTLSASATESAQQTYQDALQASRQEGRSLDSGTLGIGVVIRNAGDISFDLSDLAITALRRDLDDPTKFSTVATLGLPLTNNVVLGPGDASGVLRAEVELPANVAMELMANPDTLVFETGNFDLLDDEGRNFAFFKEVTNAQTGVVTIEYGNGNVVTARVATNVKRENGQISGVRLGDILNDILEIPFVTVENASGQRVLTSLQDNDLGTDVANVDGESIFWTVVVTHGITLTEETDFEDIVLRAGEGIYLLYLRDRDQDGLFARDEFTYRTDDLLVDTDGDGISDYDEVRTGWSVTDIGVEPYPTFVYPDPTRTDTDGDSLTDAQELEMGTDPRNADTDGEGIIDSQDEDPLDALVPMNNPPVIDTFEVTPNGLMATLEAAVIEPDATGSIIEVLVQWGDGLEDKVIENAEHIMLTHDYAESGQYTITMTATDDRFGLSSDTRDIDVSSFPLDGLIAEYFMNTDDVYVASGYHYVQDNGPDAVEREEGDPVGPRDGRLRRFTDMIWNGFGDGGVWIAPDRFDQPNSAFYFSDINAADEQYGQIAVPNMGFEVSFSLAIWVKKDVGGGGGWLVGQEDWAHMSLGNGHRVAFEIPGNGGVLVEDPTAIDDDGWHLFVATVFFDEALGSTTVRLFRDGQPVDTATNVGPALGYLSPSTSTPLMIGDGSAEDDDNNPLKAYVDDVRVWNRALSSGEIRVLCEQGGFACGGE